MPRQPESSNRRCVRALLTGAWIVTVGLTAGTARAQALAPPRVVTGEGLQHMSAAQLDALYRAANPGALPRGRVHGLPIVAPGTQMGPRMSQAARVIWQGKVFSDDGTSAVNRFFGTSVIRGNLYQGKSWLDGRPSLILDYQGTSLVYGRYRDEIREVSPGVYLGVMYTRNDKAPEFNKYFAFETRP